MKKIIFLIMLIVIMLFSCPIPGEDGKDGKDGKDGTSYEKPELQVVEIFNGDLTDDWVEVELPIEGITVIALRITNLEVSKDIIMEIKNNNEVNTIVYIKDGEAKEVGFIMEDNKIYWKKSICLGKSIKVELIVL